MIIAIDESGSFEAASDGRCFFVAVHLRQRKTLYRLKQQHFFGWETSLSKALKNSRGEIKSSELPDEQLKDFARNVVRAHYYVGISPFSVLPSANPASVIEKYRYIALTGIREGTKELAAQGKSKSAQLYDEFGHWLSKLSYPQFLKVLVLGECIAGALVNTVGHAITGKYYDELKRIQFLIDRDFIKEKRPNIFWHELLRNQLYHASKRNPLPILNKWKTKGHPFLDKYRQQSRLNFNDLFWNNCKFVFSHEHFEIRIADAIGTIVSRYLNRRQCQEAYALIRGCFLHNRRIKEIAFKDFDLGSWHYNPEDNPWKNPGFEEWRNWELEPPGNTKGMSKVERIKIDCSERGRATVTV